MTVSGSHPATPVDAWTHLLRVTGTCVAVIGGFIVLAWYAHWTALLQPSPGAVSVKINTGVCLALCGTGLALLPTRHARWAVSLGVIVGLIALGTLLEYTTHVRWSIDEMLCRDYLQADAIEPGRMSPLTALCFGVHALQLAIAGRRDHTRERLLVIALLACAVTLIACAAIVGYALNIDAAFGLGVYARMAAPTEFLFLVMGVAILAWSWREAQSSGLDLVRWLPAGASVTLMALVALGCSISLSLLQTTLDWRKHSYEVLLTAQGLLGELADTQRGMRGYVLTGQSDPLRVYRAGVKSARQTISDLDWLTQDNPAQRTRVSVLADDVQQVLSYARQLIRARDLHGLDAAMQLETTGNGLRVMDRVRDDLQGVSNAERQLLVVRETAADRNFRGTTTLVIVGSALSVMLLVLAHFLGDRELVRRRRAEARLRDSLSDRMQRLADLRLSEERFRRAFDDAPIGMALVSPRGRWLKVNRALCEMLQRTPEDFLGLNVQGINHPSEWESTARLMGQTLAGEIPGYQADKRYVRNDGGILDVRVSVSLARDQAGEPAYFIAQIEDVTLRRQVDRIKREFISTVSHELRTPLTSIRGSLGLLAAGALGPMPEKAQTMVKVAHQNSERLARIVNDILDIEKMEAGKLELRFTRIALGPLLALALETHQAYADKHQVRLLLEPESADEEVLADSDRLMQVLANLLSNAAKFSPPGSDVRVRARRHDNRVRVEVEDRGTGIPEEFRARVFEKFAQADSSSSRQFEGTGLGLSITRQLIEAMGGTIGFSTVTGKGTLFYFELPRVAAAQDIPSAVGSL